MKGDTFGMMAARKVSSVELVLNRMGEIRRPAIGNPPKILLDEWLNAPDTGSCEPRVPKSIYLRVFYDDICDADPAGPMISDCFTSGLQEIFKNPH